MPTTFSLKESIEILGTNPKTFKDWLSKARIDPDQQINLIDPRKKYITIEQLHQLARLHGRTLPAWIDDEDAEPAIATIETLSEQLTIFRTEVMQRFGQIGACLQEITAKQETLATVPDPTQAFQQQIEQRLDHLEQLLLQTLPSHQEATIPNKVSQRPKPQQAQRKAPPLATGGTKTQTSLGKAKVTSKKKTVRGKKLPRRLVALRDFASQHGIVTERASAAGKTGKIEIVQGKWLVNSRWAHEALTERGQQDFYQLFHEREGFTLCPQCPHSFQEVGTSEAHLETALG